MRRCFILEKRGDLLRQYWILPELDYPDDPKIMQKVLSRSIGKNLIRPWLYDVRSSSLVFWTSDQPLLDQDGRPLPSKDVFPFPQRNIKTLQEFVNYNNWLTTDFYKYVIKMNNLTTVMPGWENVNYKKIIPFLPVPVEGLTQQLVDEVVTAHHQSQNLIIDERKE